MKIYVACLAAYNNGQLHGSWIAPADTVEALQKQINAVLKTSPCAAAEEWAFHDYDDFPNLGENPNLETVCGYSELLDEHSNFDPQIISAVIEDRNGNLADAKADLENGFQVSSFREYAEKRADEELSAAGIDDANPLYRYFDFDAYARELTWSYHIHETSEQTFIVPS